MAELLRHHAGNLVQNATGSFSCYVADEYESGALHRVLLGLESPLPPSTTIFYRCSLLWRCLLAVAFCAASCDSHLRCAAWGTLSWA